MVFSQSSVIFHRALIDHDILSVLCAGSTRTVCLYSVGPYIGAVDCLWRQKTAPPCVQNNIRMPRFVNFDRRQKLCKYQPKRSVQQYRKHVKSQQKNSSRPSRAAACIGQLYFEHWRRSSPDSDSDQLAGWSDAYAGFNYYYFRLRALWSVLYPSLRMSTTMEPGIAHLCFCPPLSLDNT